MIRLVPMDKTDFQTYLEDAIPGYAQKQIKAGNWHPREALQMAERTYQMLLPDGLASRNRHIFSVLDEELASKVGVILFMVNNQGVRPSVLVCDFLIFDEFQRKGYGTQALMTLEESVRKLGIDRISLHVFGHNHAARALYEKMGYEATDIHMAKKLSTQEE